MEFSVKKSSNSRFRDTVEINTLEELLDFIEENGSIILSEDTIEIYDWYRE